MNRVLRLFADPETERAFLRAERLQRGPAIRALIVVAVATLLSYIVLNPLHFPREGVIAYSAAAGVLILLMAGFFLLTRTTFYLDRPWVDLPVFALLAAAMKALTLALAGQAAVTGFPPHVMALVQMGILVVFASVRAFIAAASKAKTGRSTQGRSR
jgi:ABC-type Fe3+-siderophore transport system permease subunit